MLSSFICSTNDGNVCATNSSRRRLTLDGTVRSARGIGFFVGENAKEAIVSRRREEFVAHTLPSFVEQMKLLNIEPEEIINAYNNHKDENRK